MKNTNTNQTTKKLQDKALEIMVKNFRKNFDITEHTIFMVIIKLYRTFGLKTSYFIGKTGWHNVSQRVSQWLFFNGIRCC